MKVSAGGKEQAYPDSSQTAELPDQHRSRHALMRLATQFIKLCSSQSSLVLGELLLCAQGIPSSVLMSSALAASLVACLGGGP